MLCAVASGCLFGSLAYAAPTLDRVVIGSGGGTATGGSIRLDLTIAEEISGSAQGGGLLTDLGFWCTVRAAVVGVVPEERSPASFAIRQVPNPFSTCATISYAIPQGIEVPVFLGIFDLGGRLVRTLVRERKGAGTYTVTWDGTSDDGTVAVAGVYFTSFRAGSYVVARKIAMLKGGQP